MRERKKMVPGPLSGKPERVLGVLGLRAPGKPCFCVIYSKAYVQHDFTIERHIIEILF